MLLNDVTGCFVRILEKAWLVSVKGIEAKVVGDTLRTWRFHLDRTSDRGKIDSVPDWNIQ